MGSNSKQIQLQSNRRRFLKKSAALAGVATAAGAGVSFPAAAGLSLPPSWQSTPGEQRPTEYYDYGIRSPYVKSIRIGTNGQRGLDARPGVPRDYGFRTPLQDTFGIITPASLHFIVNHAYDPPNIDPKEHRLLIHGLVDRPLVFTMDELQRLPSVSRFHFLECAGNSTPSGEDFVPGFTRMLTTATVQQTHGLTSNSEWTGVPLSVLLEKVGLKKGAKWIVAEGAEPGHHMKSVPIEKALDDVLIVYGQNGEPIRPEQGYPLRFLVPGYEGIANVKWLRRIKVVDQPYMGMRESTKYPQLRVDGKARWFQHEMGPKSVITRPSGGQMLSGPGFHEITGLAWSGGGKITRVEVSTDNGQTWKDAEIQGPAYSKSHTRFRLPWIWNGEQVVLQSRCTDERGDVQLSIAEMNKLLGIEMSFNYFKEVRKEGINHFNVIQPWRIMKNGEVQNAIFL